MSPGERPFWHGGGEPKTGEESDLKRQLVEARAYGEQLYKECAGNSRDVACAFCGTVYEAGTPRSQNSSLTEHIKVCDKHPMRDLERQLAEAQVEIRKWKAKVIEWQDMDTVAQDEIERLQAVIDELRRSTCYVGEHWVKFGP